MLIPLKVIHDVITKLIKLLIIIIIIMYFNEEGTGLSEFPMENK